MKQKIVVHIGHGKTGSSAIQAVLAKNADLLRRHGVLYPDHASFEAARLGQVSSGNLEPDQWLDQVNAAVRANPGFARYLFSNETIFYRMDALLQAYDALAADHDFEIVLFVREPLEKLGSSYQQSVKRRGFAGTLRDFAEHDTDTILAASLVDSLTRASIPFKLFNYSVTARDSVQRFFAHLDLWELVAREGQVEIGTVNRSLTAAELGLVLYVNRIFGVQFGALISDELVNHLPHLRADPVPIDAETRDYVIAANRQAVETLNQYLAPDERLRLDIPVAQGPTGHASALSDEQAEIVRKAFPGTLTYGDAVILRDIAMKYESGEPLTRADALTLMEYAHKARPEGRIIAGKLKEWRDSSA
jgi:hypothetical protein